MFQTELDGLHYSLNFFAVF